MTEPSLLELAAQGHRVLEPLHSLGYFAPELGERLTAVGLRPGRMTYFAGRSAAMGAPSAAVVAATFYNFSPDLVARSIPEAWTLADPAAILAARYLAIDDAWQRLLGADVLASPDVAEAAGLARAATTAARPEGRPLFAGWAALPWPEPVHLQLWHAITLLREHRGDGHIATLVRHDLNDIDAIVTHTATGRGFVEETGRKLRGWTEEQWAASIQRLRERGVLAHEGLTLTPAGAELRSRVEAETTELAVAPWAQLGAAGASRLIELVRPLTQRALANGAFPPGVFASR